MAKGSSESNSNKGTVISSFDYVCATFNNFTASIEKGRYFSKINLSICNFKNYSEKKKGYILKGLF